jgi:hypothetical protein
MHEIICPHCKKAFKIDEAGRTPTAHATLALPLCGTERVDSFLGVCSFFTCDRICHTRSSKLVDMNAILVVAALFLIFILAATTRLAIATAAERGRRSLADLFSESPDGIRRHNPKHHLSQWQSAGEPTLAKRHLGRGVSMFANYAIRRQPANNATPKGASSTQA